MKLNKLLLLTCLSLGAPALMAQSFTAPAKSSLGGSLSTQLGGNSIEEDVIAVDGIVAIVNNDVVTRSELDRQLATIERQMLRKGLNLPPRRDLRAQVLDRMVLDRAQIQRADEIGIRIEDKQVEDTMARVAQQNNMDLGSFLEKLREDGIRPERFRTEIKNELIISRLKELEVERRLQVSDSEVEAWLANRSSGELSVKPQVNWIQFLVKAPASETGGAAQAQADKVAAALAKGLTVEEILRTNPELAIEGTGNMGWQSFDEVPSLFTDFLSTADSESVDIVRSANGYHVLKVLGRKQSGLGGLDEKPVVQTRARHILIRVTDELTESEARRQLQFVLDKIDSDNADFSKLARQYSVDGSAAKGGDLGWLYPGDTVPEFERVMNSLQPGQVSDIIQSRFGLHVIKVDERREQVVSEDRQRLAARRAILAEKSQDAYTEWLRQLKDRTFIDIRL